MIKWSEEQSRFRLSASARIVTCQTILHEKVTACACRDTSGSICYQSMRELTSCTRITKCSTLWTAIVPWVTWLASDRLCCLDFSRQGCWADRCSIIESSIWSYSYCGIEVDLDEAIIISAWIAHKIFCICCFRSILPHDIKWQTGVPIDDRARLTALNHVLTSKASKVCVHEVSSITCAQAIRCACHELFTNVITETTSIL